MSRVIRNEPPDSLPTFRPRNPPLSTRFSLPLEDKARGFPQTTFAKLSAPKLSPRVPRSPILHRFQVSSLACSPHLLLPNVALTAGANTMDQGDDQAAMNPYAWDDEWPFVEDDWNTDVRPLLTDFNLSDQVLLDPEAHVNRFRSELPSKPLMHPILLNHHRSTGVTWSAASNHLNEQTTHGNLVEAAQSITDGFQQVCPIAANAPGIPTDGILPICDINWAEGFQSHYPNLSGPGEAADHLLTASNEDIQKSDSTTQSNPSKRASKAKKRLACTHGGCKLTFARKYELERHRKTIHDCTVSILCSVYGCNRISKPFHRLDKFFEHVRKHHKGPERFLCVVESCRQGPLTRAELVQHLNAQHSLSTLKQPHLDHVLNSLNLGGQFQKGKPVLPNNINACPLRFLGCGYSHKPSSDSKWKIQTHLRTHELLERSKEYEIIIAFLGFWEEYGIATCPICRKLVCMREGYLGIWNIIDHVDQHTKEERSVHAAEISQMFRPYLTGQEPITFWNRAEKVLEWNRGPQFRGRCQEAGVLFEAEHQTSEGHDCNPIIAPEDGSATSM